MVDDLLEGAGEVLTGVDTWGLQLPNHVGSATYNLRSRGVKESDGAVVEGGFDIGDHRTVGGDDGAIMDGEVALGMRRL